MTKGRWDFFFRAERRSGGEPKKQNARCVSIELPNDTELDEAIRLARAAGAPKGSHRTGIFEVQNDLGIWEHVDGNRIDLSTPRKTAKVIFRTWDELDKAA